MHSVYRRAVVSPIGTVELAATWAGLDVVHCGLGSRHGTSKTVSFAFFHQIPQPITQLYVDSMSST